MIADGLAGLSAAMEAMAKQGVSFKYHQVQQLIAEGNFVLALSKGEFGGQTTQFLDLFRLEKGKMVEHWDVIQDTSTNVPHSNSIFS
jgi:predicted SnoaL-like aldol condensation-catalyzing enzyme